MPAELLTQPLVDELVSEPELTPSDGEGPGDDCCIFCSPGVNSAVLALCRCDVRPVRRRASEALRDSTGTVTQFMDGLAVYALSREWNDLFAIYVCGVQPIPFCEALGEADCSPAPARHCAGLSRS